MRKRKKKEQKEDYKKSIRELDNLIRDVRATTIKEELLEKEGQKINNSLI